MPPAFGHRIETEAEMPACTLCSEIPGVLNTSFMLHSLYLNPDFLDLGVNFLLLVLQCVFNGI